MNIEKPSNNSYEEPPIHDDGISSIISDFSVREEKVILADFDSLAYFTLYSGRNEYGEKNPDFTEDDLEFLQGKLSEMIMKALNSVEKYFDVIGTYIFIRGANNFRKDLYPEYKSNRPPKPPLVNLLYNYMKENYGAVEANGAEAEDFVYTASKQLGNKCVILFCDHDILEIEGIPLFNYQKEKWMIQTKSQALLEKYKKLIVTETSDNVNLCPKLGIKHFEKFYTEDMTEDELEVQALVSYTKAWKSEQIAKEKLELCKKLVWLKEIE
jgi:5'-3' exonuclease